MYLGAAGRGGDVSLMHLDKWLLAERASGGWPTAVLAKNVVGKYNVWVADEKLAEFGTAEPKELGRALIKRAGIAEFGLHATKDTSAARRGTLFTLDRAATAAEETGAVAARTRHAEETAAAAATAAAKAALANARAATAATPSARPIMPRVLLTKQNATLRGQYARAKRDVKVARRQRDDARSDAGRLVAASLAGAEARYERLLSTLNETRQRAARSYQLAYDRGDACDAQRARADAACARSEEASARADEATDAAHAEGARAHAAEEVALAARERAHAAEETLAARSATLARVLNTTPENFAIRVTELKKEIELLKVDVVRNANATASATSNVGALEERLARFARPLTLRDDTGALDLAVRDVAVALAAESGVAINKVADVTSTIVRLVDTLLTEQRGESLGLDTDNSFSTALVTSAVHEQAEITLLNIARLAAAAVHGRCGFAGLSILFDSTSTKREYREYMSVALGICDVIHQVALDDWLGGKSAVEISSYLARFFVDKVVRRQQLLLKYKVPTAVAVTYPHSVHVVIVDNENSNPAALREFDEFRIVSHVLVTVVNTVATLAARDAGMGAAVADASVAVLTLAPGEDHTALCRGVVAAAIERAIRSVDDPAFVVAQLARGSPQRANLVARVARSEVHAILPHTPLRRTKAARNAAAEAEKAAADAVPFVELVRSRRRVPSDAQGIPPQILRLFHTSLKSQWSILSFLRPVDDDGHTRWKAWRDPLVCVCRATAQGLRTRRRARAFAIGDEEVFILLLKVGCADHMININSTGNYRLLGRLLGSGERHAAIPKSVRIPVYTLIEVRVLQRAGVCFWFVICGRAEQSRRLFCFFVKLKNRATSLTLFRRARGASLEYIFRRTNAASFRVKFHGTYLSLHGEKWMMMKVTRNRFFSLGVGALYLQSSARGRKKIDKFAEAFDITKNPAGDEEG